MADLEHDVPNGADTIFEAGSVSKQSRRRRSCCWRETASCRSTIRCAGTSRSCRSTAALITIRQMLHHTSGLRDWGSVESIAGWPRGTRVYTHAHVLDILARQQHLNFAPGTHWSYSNSGYNLR